MEAISPVIIKVSTSPDTASTAAGAASTKLWVVVGAFTAKADVVAEGNKLQDPRSRIKSRIFLMCITLLCGLQVFPTDDLYHRCESGEMQPPWTLSIAL